MKSRTKLILKTTLLAALVSTAFSAYAKGNFMSFGIATGGHSYSIIQSNIVRADDCDTRKTGGATAKKIPAHGHIMCNVHFNRLGKFSMTIQRDGTNLHCQITTSQDKEHVNKTCNDGDFERQVTIAEIGQYDKFKYGDWQVNLP